MISRVWHSVEKIDWLVMSLNMITHRFFFKPNFESGKINKLWIINQSKPQNIFIHLALLIILPNIIEYWCRCLIYRRSSFVMFSSIIDATRIWFISISSYKASLSFFLTHRNCISRQWCEISLWEEFFNIRPHQSQKRIKLRSRQHRAKS